MIENVLFFIAAYLAAIFATVAGFGSSTLLVPVAMMFMDAKTAIFLVACFHLFNNMFKVKLFFSNIDKKLVKEFGIPSILFAFVGALAINVLPVDLIKTFVGIFLMLYSVYALLEPEIKIKQSLRSNLIGGALSGLLAGLIGLGGALRSMFLISYKLKKHTYIATAALIAFVVDITRIPTYLFGGIVEDTEKYMLLPFLLVIAFFGVKVGKRLLETIDQALFQKIVYCALLALGIKIYFF